MDYYQCEKYFKIYDVAKNNSNIYSEIEKSINLYMSSTKGKLNKLLLTVY